MPQMPTLEPQSKRANGESPFMRVQLASIKGGIFPAAPHMQIAEGRCPDGDSQADRVGREVCEVA